MSFPRRVEPEVMDGEGLDPAVHREALRGLARLNGVGGSARLVWGAVRDLCEGDDGRPLRVLDVATGGGDVPLGLWRMARRRGASLEIAACDRSPIAVAHARAAAERAGAPIEVVALDALGDALPPDYDVLVCSLFLHHLAESDAVRLLERMAQAAGRRVIVNDLARSRASLALVALAARALTRSPVVRTDGPRSVRAAFTAGEMRELARRAGMDHPKVRYRFPCRLLMTWNRAT